MQLFARSTAAPCLLSNQFTNKLYPGHVVYLAESRDNTPESLLVEQTQYTCTKTNQKYHKRQTGMGLDVEHAFVKFIYINFIFIRDSTKPYWTRSTNTIQILLVILVLNISMLVYYGIGMLVVRNVKAFSLSLYLLLSSAWIRCCLNKTTKWVFILFLENQKFTWKPDY